MSESDIIEVNENEYRINGISNKTFPSRVAAKEHIRKVKEEEAAEWEALLKKSSPKQNNNLSL